MRNVVRFMVVFESEDLDEADTLIAGETYLDNLADTVWEDNMYGDGTRVEVSYRRLYNKEIV